MGRRPSAEARTRKRERHAANVAAREDTGTAPAVKVEPVRLALITGPYDASHLRPTRVGDDPGLLAQPWQPWQHLLPCVGGERRRQLSVAIEFHPTCGVRTPAWMGRAA